MERTLVLVKPDGIQRGLIGEVVSKFEQKGLKLVGIKMMTLDEAVLREHYAHIANKPFYKGVEKFMRSTPIIAMCWEGVEAIETVRILAGITKARAANPGTIRGDFAMSVACNVIHASDGFDTASKELKRFFKPDEIFEYDKSEYMHVYLDDEIAGNR